MRLLVSSMCKIGGREYNQDYTAYSNSPEGSCFVVCDGLGSYKGSEVASRLCSAKIVEDFERVREADPVRTTRGIYCDAFIENAHNFIIAHKDRNPEIENSCTTVAAAVTNEKGTRFFHVGDSRIYFFKKGSLLYQSKDHSLSQVAVDMGQITLDEIRTHKDQNKLTRVVGSDYFVPSDTEFFAGALEAGDSILLCTDGFWEYVFEAEMEEDISYSKTPEDALDKMEKRLLARVTHYNDNYSAILIMAVDKDDE